MVIKKENDRIELYIYIYMGFYSLKEVKKVKRGLKKVKRLKEARDLLKYCTEVLSCRIQVGICIRVCFL